MSRRKDDWAKKWVGIFIIIIMVMSVAGFAFGFVNHSGNSLNRYNDHKFEQSAQTGEWIVEIDDIEYSFFTHPTQVAGLPIEQAVIERLKEAFQITFTFSPNLTQPEYVDVARLRLGLLLAQQGVGVQQAITQQSENYNLPVVSCKDAQQFQPVITFIVGNTTEATAEGNCLRFTSTTEIGLLELSEAVSYQLLGVLADGEQ